MPWILADEIISVIGKVAVGMMDVIEMVVDEQAELGVYQVLAKQM